MRGGFVMLVLGRVCSQSTPVTSYKEELPSPQPCSPILPRAAVSKGPFQIPQRLPTKATNLSLEVDKISRWDLLQCTTLLEAR